MVTGPGVPKVNSRGKHDNRPNRTPSVKKHIRSFPTYQSHYSRRSSVCTLTVCGTDMQLVLVVRVLRSIYSRNCALFEESM